MEMNTARVAIMSWHVHKNIMLRAVKLYNEFVWAQKILMQAGDENFIVVA